MSAYHARVKLMTFLFGQGWWILWHLFIVGSAIPMFFAMRWLRRSTRSADPQGGTTIFVVLVGIALGLLVATVADGAMLGWKLAEWRGAMWGTIAGLVFCTLWTAVVFASAKRLLEPGEDDSATSRPAAVFFAIWHAGIVVANLVALQRLNG